MKLALAIVLFGLASQGSGLKCRVCETSDPADEDWCASESDNGVSKECVGPDSDVCVYAVGSDGTHDIFARFCDSKDESMVGDNGCIDVNDDGIEGTYCWCSTDDCNMGNQCDCSSSTTIGISALTLIVSTLLFLEMK